MKSHVEEPFRSGLLPQSLSSPTRWNDSYGSTRLLILLSILRTEQQAVRTPLLVLVRLSQQSNDTICVVHRATSY